MNLRKIVFAAAVVACVSVAANAEVHPNGIGLRFGGWSLWGSEINYQLGMGEANRLEIGIGWSGGEGWEYYYYPPYNRDVRVWTTYSSFGAFGAYQWHWNISPSAARGGFNWYAGPGAGVGVSSKKAMYYPENTYGHNFDKIGVSIDVGGQIGIEYDFNVLGAPILLDIDSRPTINLPSGGIGLNIALAVRYTF